MSALSQHITSPPTKMYNLIVDLGVPQKDGVLVVHYTVKKQFIKALQ